MEEAGILEKITRSGFCYPALNQVLNNKAELAKVEATLRDDPSITMLVNNAGIGAVTPLLNSDVEKIDDMIALNLTALTRLTFAAAPAFVARGRGTIINIASIVGISPETLNGVYGATKAYVISAQPFSAARARRQRHPHPGGAACRDGNRLLG